MEVLTKPASTASANDTFPINGTDHLEFYVGNAKQSAMYYMAALGFELVAYCGPETKVYDRVSYVLQQNKVRIVLTSSLHPDTEIANHVALLASVAFVFAAVYVYQVPGETVIQYLLMILILLLGVMAVAAVLVAMSVIARKYFKS